MPQEGHPRDRELRLALSAADHGNGEDAAAEVADVLDVHLASGDATGLGMTRQQRLVDGNRQGILNWRYVPYTKPKAYGSGDIPPSSMALHGTVAPF